MHRELVLILILAVLTVLLGIGGYRMTTGGLSSGSSASTEREQMPAEVLELTSPSVIAAGDGSGVFFLIDQEEADAESDGSGHSGTVWTDIMSAMQDFLSGRTKSTAIGESEYAEIAAGSTVEAVFSCALPFEEFMEYHELKSPGGTEIGSVSRITFSAAEGGTICVYDGKEEKYYRITSRKHTESLTGDLIDGIRTSAEKNATAENRRYASGGVWYGGESLLPSAADPAEHNTESAESGTSREKNSLSADSPAAAASTAEEAEAETRNVPAALEFTPEYDPVSKDSVSRLEEVFFPKGMDFIQKLEHPDGSLTYMYGTTEKVLKVEADGGFTFSTEKKGSRWKPDFYSALSGAVKYIKKKGGWPGGSGEVTVRLTSAEPIEKKSDALVSYSSSGWRFIFGLEVLGLPLVYDEEDEIQMYVDVYGSGVTEYHRDLPELAGSYSSGGGQAAAGSNAQNSTSSEQLAAASGGESASPSVQQAEALSLEKVIKADSAVLLTALADRGMKLEKMTAEELEAAILEQITSADLQFLRIKDQSAASSAEGSRASSEKGSSPGSSGSSPAPGVRNSGKQGGSAAAGWKLHPAWKIRLNEKVFLFDAVTGQLLQSS